MSFSKLTVLSNIIMYSKESIHIMVLEMSCAILGCQKWRKVFSSPKFIN